MTLTEIQKRCALPDIRQLRAARYNAVVTAVLPVHADLRILRVVPDEGMPQFEPGQFLTLGLGNWEPRVEGVEEERIDAARYRRLTKRAYSISCSLLDETGLLRRPADFPYLEFYVVLIRHGEKRPPSLTPRLFALAPGDRLFVERRAAGNYTLRHVRPETDVFFFATGTGEAPHNAMIAELLARGHQGRIVNVVSVRHLRDAGYRLRHQRLMLGHPNYRYFVLTTREPEADRPSSAGSHGHCRIQDFVNLGQLERESGVCLDPAKAHVFLCGNSEMIGARHATVSPSAQAKPGSMLELLFRRGFQCHSPGKLSNIHFERYW
jgi:ferredoxin--NADP+ reductase